MTPTLLTLTSCRRALRFTGRLNQALESIDRALELSDSVLYHNEKGRIHIVREEYALAEAAYNRALEIDPNNAVALSGLGDIAYFSGDVESSIPFFIRSAEADPTYTYALYSWAYSPLRPCTLERCAEYCTARVGD